MQNRKLIYKSKDKSGYVRRTTTFNLDAADAAILHQLLANARLPLAELARRVKLSPPSVSERMRRLEEAGVITGYHAAINPARLGFALTLVIRARPRTC
jgi:Lrp/AsnC family leucine-responsive transcriptional regulator